MRVHDLDDAKHRLGSTHIASWPKRMKVFQPYAYIYIHISACRLLQYACMHTNEMRTIIQDEDDDDCSMLLAACLPALKTGACLHAFAPTRPHPLRRVRHKVTSAGDGPKHAQHGYVSSCMHASNCWLATGIWSPPAWPWHVV